jgi:hypothetical protein
MALFPNMSTKSHIISGDQRLSQSPLWQIQRHYFRRDGLKAWREDIVPHAISSNPAMARAYSQVALGYWRDCVTAVHNNTVILDPTQPLYIIELGAGSGRLAYHFLHHHLPQMAQSSLAHLPIKYVMTDFVPEIVDFWQSHKRLQPWIEAGVLDFALFDVTEMQPLSLRHAQLTLTPNQLHNPFILIANYFFDSIPQDSFVLADEQLCENLLTISSSQPEPNLADPTIWDRLDLAYEAIPLEQPYYEEASYNEILAEYEATFPDTTLTFPNVGLDCVRFWQGFGNGRYLLLTADRGYTLPESLLDQDDPLPNLHGSFSLMVNYHAIGQYVERAGGLVLYPPHYQDNLQVVAYLLGDVVVTGRETSLAFQQALNPDDFFALKTAVDLHLPTFTLPQLLSYLRLSAYDADIFANCLPLLLAQLPHISPAWYSDVYEVAVLVWQGYFPLGEEGDLAAEIGRMLMAIGFEAEAHSLFGGV